MQYIQTASACDTVDGARALLAQLGWVVVPQHMLTNGARALLGHFGRILPQYNGQETWEVQVRPGFETVPYSQSSNGIGAHTEVPVGDPPPKYLALHCHRQAHCGGGYTMLADGVRFCERHGGVERYSAREVEFIATPTPGSELRRSLRVPMLSRKGNDVIFRFSYNQFRYGDVNPSEDAVIAPDTALNRDPELVELTGLAERYFEDEGVALLVPEGAMLIWDNHRMMHSRTQFEDKSRHLTRYWLA